MHVTADNTPLVRALKKGIRIHEGVDSVLSYWRGFWNAFFQEPIDSDLDSDSERSGEEVRDPNFVDDDSGLEEVIRNRYS